MTWDGNPGTAIAGSVLTAAFWNIEVRDRMNVLRPGGLALASQAAGDLLYAVDADSLGRVAITSGQVLQGQGASAPAGVWALETSQNAANQLDNGDDLDNVTTRGLYHWAGGTPPANDPLGGKFSSMLVTVDAGQPQQLVWSGQGGSFRMAMRRRDSGTWTSWKEAFSIANPPAFTNITGSIADGQVPASAVTQHLPVVTIILSLAGAEVDDADTPDPVVTNGILHWLFDASTDEIIRYSFRMPGSYGSALKVVGKFSMVSATTGSARWSVRVWAMSDGDAADMDSESYAAENVVDVAVPATAGRPKDFEITIANADGLVAGDRVVIEFRRDADHANDTASGDAELRDLALEYTGA